MVISQATNQRLSEISKKYMKIQTNKTSGKLIGEKMELDVNKKRSNPNE